MDDKTHGKTGLGSKQRARTAKEKDARRSSLLAAALQLLLEQNGQLPTVHAIAAKAGVAKGTAYIYFKSKEAIYMALFEQQLFAWFAAVRDQLRFHSGDMNHSIVDALLSFKQHQPYVWLLASLSHFTLEPALDKNDLLHHKTKLAQEYRSTAAAICTVADRDTHALEEIQTRLLQSYAYLLGCWQVVYPPVAITSLISGPGLTTLQPDFYGFAQQGLHKIWSGPLQQQERSEEKAGMFQRLFQRS
ncbi:hypothetical protein CWE15_00205 [Aliidiomarina taiwanensis]|uniref:HTH tetR-type domain-containing protein n=1 Tax=Aliidiomarina taiwanensis TaxID=946228 RepID=A0A432X8L2_9GAMM|nr:TetR/AcrR family transcriptional regulator [Aliidiomarina taiwanensis]RUO43660.1 hypothetical protein CWE15_00205 [Aliidiomarina taiwanensis]